MRQLVATAVELGIAQGLLAKGQRRGIRGGEYLGFDQLVDAGFAWVIGLRGIPAMHDLLPLPVIQQWQLSHSLAWVADDAL